MRVDCRWAVLVGTGSLLCLACSRPPEVPEPPCRVTPPADYNSEIAQKRALELEAKVANAPLEAGAQVADEATAAIEETYQTIGEKQVACGMLLQAINCADERRPNSQTVVLLTDKVSGLCQTPAAAGSTSSDDDTARGLVAADATPELIATPAPPQIKVTMARIGCLDIQHDGNLTQVVGSACNGKRSCSYKAPTEAVLDGMGVSRKTRTLCTQGMEITYECSDGRVRFAKVNGDAWDHPPADLLCS